MARPILFSLLLAVLLALTANAQVTVSSSTSTSTSTTTAHSSTSTSTTAKPTPTATSTSTQQPPKPTDPAVQPLPLSILATPRRGVCKKQCVRKEVNSMSDDEWNRYAGAIKQLNQGQGGSQMTPYEALVQDHLNNVPTAHGVDAFFVWHRYFLARFEQTLQNIDPSICVPYWDWARTSQNYRAHPMFSSRRMGSPRGGCITDGSFAGWNTRQTGGACVQRAFDGSLLTATQFVVAMMQGAPDYHDFRVRYEAQCHGGPHVSIGGMMAIMASPSDPIFWSHHAMVDKHWADYKDFQKGGNYPNPGERLAQWGLPASDMEDYHAWCYTYGSTGFGDEPSPRQPSGIPDTWLQMTFHGNLSEVNATKALVNASLANGAALIANGTDLSMPQRPDSPFDKPTTPSSAMAAAGLSVAAVVVSVLAASL